MKLRKHVQYNFTQHFRQRIQYPFHPDTMFHLDGETHRNSTQNIGSTLGLATASNVQRSGFETSNEKK